MKASKAIKRFLDFQSGDTHWLWEPLIDHVHKKMPDRFPEGERGLIMLQQRDPMWDELCDRWQWTN